MAAHLLYEDFLHFLDTLSARPAWDAWEVYQETYLNRHREVLEAWWEQCMGRPEEVWADRVRGVKVEHYGLLREVVAEGDLKEMAAEAMARCQAALPMSSEPEVYYLVGFFSPDGFAFRVAEEWAIGIGMERLGSLRLVPILLAHEYAHCYRRARGSARSLGERMVEEGFAVELSARAFPERERDEHLLMRPSQVAALEEYEGRLWEAVEPFLGSKDEGVAARVLYGRTEGREWPSRAGVYLGWQVVGKFLASEPQGFDASAAQVLATRGAS